jgi:hypothetical protein
LIIFVKIKLFATADRQLIYETSIEIPDDKLELLDADEQTAAIEVNVRSWASEQLLIDWEVDAE